MVKPRIQHKNSNLELVITKEKKIRYPGVWISNNKLCIGDEIEHRLDCAKSIFAQH